jgi:hypothetical protein
MHDVNSSQTHQKDPFLYGSKIWYAWLFLAFSDAFFRRISFGLHTHSAYIEWLVLHHHVQYRVLQPSSRLSGFGFQRSGSTPFFGPAKTRTNAGPRDWNPTEQLGFIPPLYQQYTVPPLYHLPPFYHQFWIIHSPFSLGLRQLPKSEVIFFEEVEDGRPSLWS